MAETERKPYLDTKIGEDLAAKMVAPMLVRVRSFLELDTPKEKPQVAPSVDTGIEPSIEKTAKGKLELTPEGVKVETAILNQLKTEWQAWIQRIETAQNEDDLSRVKKDGFGALFDTCLELLNTHKDILTEEQRDHLKESVLTVMIPELDALYTKKQNELVPKNTDPVGSPPGSHLDKVAPEVEKPAERTYEELEKLVSRAEKKQYASIVAEGLGPFVDYVKSNVTVTLQSLIDSKEYGGVEKVAEALFPALLDRLPKEWSKEEKDMFAMKFTIQEINESI